MGEKPVTDLAGIGNVLGKRLESKGFDKAYVVLGQFLLLKKNKIEFVKWMKSLVNANSKQSEESVSETGTRSSTLLCSTFFFFSPGREAAARKNPRNFCNTFVSFSHGLSFSD